MPRHILRFFCSYVSTRLVTSLTNRAEIIEQHDMREKIRSDKTNRLAQILRSIPFDMFFGLINQQLAESILISRLGLLLDQLVPVKAS